MSVYKAIHALPVTLGVCTEKLWGGGGEERVTGKETRVVVLSAQFTLNINTLLASPAQNGAVTEVVEEVEEEVEKEVEEEKQEVG